VGDAGDVPEVRPPTIDDIRRICRALDEAGARYVLIGGFAVVLHGGLRTTKDIDLLVDPEPANVERLKRALSVLEDDAAREIDPADLRRYSVVRVADESSSTCWPRPAGSRGTMHSARRCEWTSRARR
jgi:hypothetical protein